MSPERTVHRPPAPPSAGEVTVLPLTREDADDLLALSQWTWGNDPDEYALDDDLAVLDSLEWDRTYAARLSGAPSLSGCYSVVSGDVTLPGGRSARASGLTWVGVHPRDRRRGVLTAMIRHHLEDVAARGEPFSLLFASEATIYGRFGYGAASRGVGMTIGRGAGLRDVPGAGELVADFDTADADRHAARLADCYERGRAARPGWLARENPGARREALFLDPVRRRHGAESLKLLTVSTPDGELRGYALFRRREKWRHGNPDGSVEVGEVVALDAAASRALWGRLVGLDLMGRVHVRPLPPDDPLPQLLVDPRAASPMLTDRLWARLVDVPAALAARGYATGVDVVLEVADGLRPGNAGRWHLVADADGATCTRTDRTAQLELDVRELGAAYLGGPSLAGLAAAGLVTVRDPAALAAASTAFGSVLEPHCPWNF